MALDLSLLGATGVQAVAKLVSYTLGLPAAKAINPHYIKVVYSASPFNPLVNATVSAVTVNDSAGNPPIYTGSQSISYNRVGYQQAFQGLGLQYTGPGPYTVGEIVAGLYNDYGIVIEQADIQELFANPIAPNLSGYVELHPSGSLRYWIDFSPFTLKITINANPLTELQKLIAMQKLADMSALNAANTPSSPPAVPEAPILDR